MTEGAACTVLAARELIDNNQPLMIANSDQYVECEINQYLEQGDAPGVTGHMMTFHSNHPKWSYCRLDPVEGQVMDVVEKQVISNEATVGIYNFRHGHDFVKAADQMIAGDLRVNGEFYVAPAYNILIKQGARILPVNIGAHNGAMHGLGTPEDFARFQESSAFLKRQIKVA